MAKTLIAYFSHAGQNYGSSQHPYCHCRGQSNKANYHLDGKRMPITFSLNERLWQSASTAASMFFVDWPKNMASARKSFRHLLVDSVFS